MAEQNSRIFGTEEDKFHCPFYFKIGACRHGDRCSRSHIRPQWSQTILLPHIYVPPNVDENGRPLEDPQEHFEIFWEDLFDELSKYGYVEEINVVQNMGDHMFGNVYVRYAEEEDAEKAVQAINQRYYGGRQLTPEYSPVTDFREARCRLFDETTCNRGNYCNFMHLYKIPSALKKRVRSQRKRKASRSRSKSKSRSSRRDRSRERSRGRERSRNRSRDRGDRKEKEKDRREDDRGLRGSSAERRAKIAEWNKARAAAPSSVPAPAAAEPAPI